MTVNNNVELDFQNIELGKHPTRSIYSFAEITIAQTAIEKNGRGRTTLSIKFGENGVKKTVTLGKTVPADAQNAVARWQGLLDSIRIDFLNEGKDTTCHPALFLNDGDGVSRAVTHWYVNGTDNEQEFTRLVGNWLRAQKPRDFINRPVVANMGEKPQVLAAA